MHKATGSVVALEQTGEIREKWEPQGGDATTDLDMKRHRVGAGGGKVVDPLFRVRHHGMDIKEGRRVLAKTFDDLQATIRTK